MDMKKCDFCGKTKAISKAIDKGWVVVSVASTIASGVAIDKEAYDMCFDCYHTYIAENFDKTD